MAKVSVNLDDDLDGDDSARKLKELSAPLPSVSKAKFSALKDAPRVQFSFTNVPKPIKDAFAAEAQRRRLTQKELLYECLRAGGINIPNTAEIDGRKR
jgi:molybdenum cofactor biosynthesis enzyme MoaA